MYTRNLYDSINQRHPNILNFKNVNTLVITTAVSSNLFFIGNPGISRPLRVSIKLGEDNFKLASGMTSQTSTAPETSREAMGFVPGLFGSSGRLESRAYFPSIFPFRTQLFAHLLGPTKEAFGMDLSPSQLPKTSLPKTLLHQRVSDTSRVTAPQSDGAMLNGFLNSLTLPTFISKMCVHFGILMPYPYSLSCKHNILKFKPSGV